MMVQTTLDKQLERFWELEEVNNQILQTPADQRCETLYEETHYRDTDGRYVVQLPFKEELVNCKLGESRHKAVARLIQLEKKLNCDDALKEQYVNFMKEFMELGHMVKVRQHENQGQSYYLPHHAVYKPDSTTTKLRVVFDGSAKTSTGISLNNLMLVGPRLQEDLTTIMLRWRKHKYVFTADIEKMYRQIKISTCHQDYQRIVWRDSTSNKIEDFKLTTVTYGTAAGQYLAVKMLHQISIDEKSDIQSHLKF